MDLRYDAFTVSVVGGGGTIFLRCHALTTTIKRSCTHREVGVILLIRIVDNHIIGSDYIVMRHILSGLIKRALPAANLFHNLSTSGLETNRAVAFALPRLVYLLRCGLYLRSTMGISTFLSILSN